jgi:glycosyltransferase involved in cell wall biosynthesis
MRVALVHDWLTGMRGGEKVLDVLCELYPDADLFTLIHEPGRLNPRIERHRITTSVLQQFPALKRRYRHCLPFFPALIERFDFSGYDLVVSSSHCVAKSVIVPPGTVHVCYCHSPMRYAWDQFEAYFGVDRVGPAAHYLLYRPVMRRLARWDARTAGRVGRFVANSRYVAGRIERYYNRASTVVYPPVDTTFYEPSAAAPGPHFLIVSALVPYKRIDLAIDATRRAGRTLRIVGEGPERARLEAEGHRHVTFLGRLPDEAVREEYRQAAAVLLPAEEDFGIVPLEAQACGRPVVALGKGGALETVLDGETGVLVPDSDPATWAAALARIDTLRLSPDAARRQAERFSRDACLTRLKQVIDETVSAGAGRQW